MKYGLSLRNTQGDKSHNLSCRFSYENMPENPLICVKHRLLDPFQGFFASRTGKQTFSHARSVGWRICAPTKLQGKPDTEGLSAYSLICMLGAWLAPQISYSRAAVGVSALWGQSSYQILPELKWQAVVSCRIWMLGVQLRSHARAVCVLNHLTTETSLQHPSAKNF